ncbi:MAG: hypothetical protein E4H01_02275 [Lysobacterales bacterium]|nr:MAG: hypothetical protein E4H01_02275 [Xanthomonadales bacterium]
MPKCYMTGIEIRLDDAFILDRREASRALKELRGKQKALERLVAELGEVDRVELRDWRTGKTFTRIDSRMVCISVAQALSAIWSEKTLFVRWSEWKAQRKEIIQNLKDPPEGGRNGQSTTHDEGRNGTDV